MGHPLGYQNGNQQQGTEKPTVLSRDTKRIRDDGIETQPILSDPDTDSKLKHAVGKAISKTDSMGADIENIVECYPGQTTRSEILQLLEERGTGLGMKEMYGKWYI